MRVSGFDSSCWLMNKKDIVLAPFIKSGKDIPMADLTDQERVDRLIKDFGWTETEAWNFLEEMMEDNEDD